VLFDAVCVPGAAASAQRLAAMPEAVEFLQQAYKHCKAIGAIGAGKDVLAAASICGTDAAAAAAGVVVDPGNKVARFAKDFTAAIAAHRHWAREDVVTS
jgi:catalase